MLKRLTAFLLALAVIVLSGCANKTDSKTAIYFDTVVSLSAKGGIPSNAFALCERYDKLISVTNQDSQIYKLNQEGKLSVDDDVAELIQLAMKYSKLSNGKFDITVHPVKQLWDFKNEKIPTKSQINEAKKKVGYKNVKVSGNEITLLGGAQIDLGAIAKGYIADRLAELYISENKSGVINLGGNIMLPKTRKKPYKIGITDPKDTKKTAAVVEVTGGAVVTSGTYQRSFSKDGKLYHHILDTDTGYPVETGIASVTILAESATTADALSTTVICMGKTEGLTLINGMDNTEAVIITDSGEILLSDGLKQIEDTIKIKQENM